MVRGDLFSLREATKNLVNNAFVHGAPPVTISVGRSAHGGCRLAVSDKGPGLAIADSEIGTRFARNENSAESAGLGLAIVREVTHSHDGRLSTERTERGGFAIAIDLPAFEERPA